jgi:hypothetical protein
VLNILWVWTARLVRRPRLQRLISRLAKRRPHIHIEGYMQRWWLIPRVRLLPFAVRVHHILRSDPSPLLHDHPWNWRSIVLAGHYVEEDSFGERHLHPAGTTHAARAEALHRIDEVSGGGVWTLFIMYRKRNRWGFVAGVPPRKMRHVNDHG